MKRKFPVPILSLNPGGRALICLALASCTAPGLRADVTIRYQSNFKPAAGLPPVMAQAMKAAQNMGSSTLIRMKGHKANSTSGDTIAIIDFVKQELTLVDASHKAFATFPVSEFADRIAAAMPAGQMKAAQQAAASIKTKVDSRVTGRTEAIQDVQAEEREITVSMDMPIPANLPQIGVKLVMQMWTAQQGEVVRVPAIRELAGFNMWQRYFLNPAGMVEKLGGNAPGAAGMIKPIFEELFKNQSVLLRMHIDIYMPSIAALVRQMAGQTEDSAAAIDPNAPIMEMNQEAVELSNAPVDASLFEIPKEYSAAPADDLIRGMVLKRALEGRKSAGEIAFQPTPSQSTSDPRPPMTTEQAAPSTEGGVYRVGGGVSAPVVIYKKDPEYSEEARKAHLWGNVVLQLVVGSDGLPHNIRVIRPLGMGLDERAIETVGEWRFRPGEKQGSPVNVLATIEVTFRLLEPGGVWRIGRLVFEGGGSARPVLTKWRLPDGPVPDRDLRVTFKLNVGTSGDVTDASAEGASDPALAAPLQEAVRKWKFDVPDGSHAANYPATLDLTYGNPGLARIPPSRAGKIRAEPKNAEEAYREGVRLIRAQVPEQAIPLLTRVIQERPEWEAAYSSRAQAYYSMKRYHETIDDLTVAIRLNPNQASLYNRRGLSYSYSGRHDIAIDDYNRAIELSTNPSAMYYNNRGWAYLEMEQADKALTDLNKAVEIAPDYVRAFENRGSAYMKLKDYSHATADFTAASQLTATRWQLEHRAEAKRLSGDETGAEEDLKRASDLPLGPPR